MGGAVVGACDLPKLELGGSVADRADELRDICGGCGGLLYCPGTYCCWTGGNGCGGRGEPGGMYPIGENIVANPAWYNAAA